jgi:hypothetical protein
VVEEEGDAALGAAGVREAFARAAAAAREGARRSGDDDEGGGGDE